ncbi:uncharacterized protein LOC111281593 [Durio zibethinus]|uniref:Uncharacterized protein LOC111281593 n=1 Tax=Durio zibethinus TaxID=66656 RepID=A0A6P5X9E6_DURZI|nr:uncharacterized protein LOC111281593 [Durio zibethinus]
MEFKDQGKWKTLHGIKSGTVELVDDKQTTKLLQSLTVGQNPYPCTLMLTFGNLIQLNAIRMNEADIYKIAFRNHDGHYEFLLRKVFELLKAHRLFLKRSVCEFGANEIEYLGHVISANGVEMDKNKISSIIDRPIPKLVKELREFLGLKEYYRRFIRNYGLLARPLTELLRKDAFNWSETTMECFRRLKTAMTIVPVLALLDFIKTFMVETDASGFGVGAVLT